MKFVKCFKDFFESTPVYRKFVGLLFKFIFNFNFRLNRQVSLNSQTKVNISPISGLKNVMKKLFLKEYNFS